ncbi:MAG: T9SS type A sorting domain-containing protein [Bacteroidales bacterium]|nr:T9SS type A sorting domain-containing protein [Bacteroidales bacterium]
MRGGTWSWSGPGGFTASGRELKIRDAQYDQSGTYTVTYINSCGAFTSSYFHLTVHDNDDFYAEYQWKSYEPGLNYDFRDEFPDLTEPQEILDDCEEVVGTYSSGWWTFRWGPTANSLVTLDAVIPMLERMNTDFAYFRDVMGWPPDKRAKNGYKSAIYLYGSGLCTDDASNTDPGGWQSSITYEGESWPMVLISYYPVYCFDPSCTYDDREYQTGAVVHEGIHSVLADLPGCRNAAWFHEGGNTWLQQEADSRRSGDYSSMGFLNGASFIAPFMPIECYSGWLQDGSFGGPSAEGVNMFEGSTQVCTWRNLLGGVQYSNVFPTFLGQTLGLGSVPWIWRYCPSRVLEGMADGLGDSQTRRLISEYRAKQALIDMGEWTSAIKNLIDTQFGTSIKSDWEPSWLNPPAWFATPYVETTIDGDGMLSPDPETTPGWSGANQVPLVVNSDSVTVNFIPKAANMTCQLCYRTRDGQLVYSTPVYGGNCSLRLDKSPANNVVFAVITNTDYVYEGEKTRKAHYDYRLQLVEGLAGAADPQKRWYDWTKTITPSVSVEDIPAGPGAIIYPNPVASTGNINIDFTEPLSEKVNLSVMTLTGALVYEDLVTGNTSVSTTEFPGSGLYIISLDNGSSQNYYKLLVR